MNSCSVRAAWGYWSALRRLAFDMNLDLAEGRGLFVRTFTVTGARAGEFRAVIERAEIEAEDAKRRAGAG